MKPSVNLIALILICYCPLLMAELIAGNDGTQATTANQPVYVGSDAAYIVHASVQFDGADDWMDLLWRIER